MQKLVGLLRGINVGGHHKVPMAELKKILTQLGCENVKTILNSGNFVFESKNENLPILENKIETVLAKSFGFAIPVFLIPHKQINALVNEDPFASIDVHKNIRLYITFLKEPSTTKLTLPYISKDNSFRIIDIKKDIIISVLDITTTSTPKGMEDLEKLFGKNITTRNWNTIQKIHNC